MHYIKLGIYSCVQMKIISIILNPVSSPVFILQTGNLVIFLPVCKIHISVPEIILFPVVFFWRGQKLFITYVAPKKLIFLVLHGKQIKYCESSKSRKTSSIIFMMKKMLQR